MSCGDIKNQLDEYITGELEQAAANEVRQHLISCSECRAEYEALKSLKAELKALAKPVPEGFDERLREKIKNERHKHYFNINRFGVSAAAAVVLICIIGLGYGMGHNLQPENKLQAVNDRVAVNNADQQPIDKSDSIDKEKQEITEPATEQNTEAESEKQREIATEAGKGEQSKSTVDVQPRAGGGKVNAAEESNVQADAAQEQRSIADKAVVPETEQRSTADKNAVPEAEATPKTAAFGGNVEFDSGADFDNEKTKDSNDHEQLPSSGGGGGAKSRSVDMYSDTTAEAYGEFNPTVTGSLELDVNLIVSESDLLLLEERLKGIGEVSNVAAEDGFITADVKGISYDELIDKLQEIDITKQGIYVDSTCMEFSVRFETK